MCALIPILCVCTCRFVYAHLVGKCRRQVILDYFGEAPQMATATGECCDVCSSTSTTDSITADYHKYFLIITTTVCEIPDKGEKKVNAEIDCMIELYHRHFPICENTLPVFYMNSCRVCPKTYYSWSWLY